jgi:hypothetical protein
MTQSAAAPMNFTNADGSTVQVGVTYAYTPAPVVESTKWGFCPRTGETLKDFQASDAIYGGTPAVGRRYDGAALTAMPDASREWIASFKTFTLADLPRIKTIAETTAELLFDHEIDHQILVQSGLTIASWKKAMQAMLDYGVPNLAICLTADCFVNPNKNPTDYLIDGVQVDVDFDGVPPNESKKSYHDYSKELTAVDAFWTKYDCRGSIPEWNTARGTFDPDDSIRAAWQRTWARNFINAGAKRACWWEGPSVANSYCDMPATRQTLTTLLRFA